MRNLIAKMRDLLRPGYDPDPTRRLEVIALLAERKPMSDSDWLRQLDVSGIPSEFVASFRVRCSEAFGYQLDAALPGDRLVDDLGLYSATWSDTDMDILEAFDIQMKSVPEDRLQQTETMGQLAVLISELSKR